MAQDADIQAQIIQHLKSIPIFHRLTDEELAMIYQICTFRQLSADEKLYKFGTASDGLFILLDGQLVARAPTGQDIAYINPVDVVGEMGVLTDEPRSADVDCMTDAMGFEMTRDGLINLFVNAPAVSRKILFNVVKILSQRLYDTNAEIQKLRDEQERGKPSTDDIFLY